MTCKKFERMISDDIDGSLSLRKKERLAGHLGVCSACRSYGDNLRQLQSAGKSSGRAELPEAYWTEFPSRLAARLSVRVAGSEKRFQPYAVRPKWALSAAAFVLIVGAALLFFLLRPQGLGEHYIFSLEDSLAEIYQEIDGDADLENAFNQTLVASIGETLRASHEEINPFFGENPLFWEGLTDEEMQSIEEGLRIEKN